MDKKGEGRKEREDSEYIGNGKETGRNTFLNPCLSIPVAKQSRSKHKKKCSSFLRTLLKVNFKFKMEETASQDNTYHNVPWILKLTGTGYSSCSTVF